MVGQSTAVQAKICRDQGLLAEPSFLETLAPELDVILSFPIDPIHSEFLGLGRRLYSLVIDCILKTKALPAFTTVYRKL
jgi:hypothetical protein